MTNRQPQESSNSNSKGRKKVGFRRQVLSQRWTADGVAYTPGQLHMLGELITEFAPHLESDRRGVKGLSEWILTSEVPNLLDFMEHQLQRLREAQADLEALWQLEAGPELVMNAG